MKSSVFVDPLLNESQEKDVVEPVIINGVVLSPKALSFLTCMQADGNAYIHEIRDHILQSISRSLTSIDYLEENEITQSLEEIRYLNKFIRCIEYLAAESIVSSCICLFAV